MAQSSHSPPIPWHQLAPAIALQRCGTHPSQGLSQSEAARRLAQQGPNELIHGQTKGLGQMAWEQLTEPLVVLLIVAAALSALLGDYREAVVILMIVVLNGLLGVSQEYRAEQHIMARPPYAPGENFFSRGLGWSIVWVGILMGGFSLGTGYWAWRQGLPTWQTMLFTVLTLSQMGNALALRSERNSFWQVGPWSNPALLGAVALTLAAQVAVIYTLPLRTLFYTQPLSLGEFLLCLGLSSGVFWCIEAEKWWQRHRLKAKTGSPRS